MASSFTLPPLLHKSHFLGQTNLKPNYVPKSPKTPSPFYINAKFDLFQIMGGRGLCNGEQGLQQELNKTIQPQPTSPLVNKDQEKSTYNFPEDGDNFPEDGFEKELLGLTGGFPGGEKGLESFIKKNPPPKKPLVEDKLVTTLPPSSKKSKAPELPLLMPGMIAIVKNTNSPYYMLCGIVQRITDGKAGVLFEGGNWDRLITFRLDELQRREKGPLTKNPRSCVLEPLLEKET